MSVNVSNEFGVSHVPWRHYRRTHGDGYMCVLPATYPVNIAWNVPVEHEVDVTFYSAGGTYVKFLETCTACVISVSLKTTLS